MRRALTYLVTATLALVMVAIAGSFLLPRQVHVERSIVIARPACTIYALVDGFGRQREWSPWAALDPETAYEFTGPERGVGATMTWASESDNVGSGRQVVVGAEPCRRVDTSLQFEDMGPSRASFLLEPAEGGTQVTWTLDAELGLNPIARLMGTQFDRWVGADYEKGLASIKSLAEQLPDTDFAGLQVEEVKVAPVPLATVPAAAARSPMAVGMALGTSYAQIEAAVAPVGLAIAGNRRASFRSDGDGWAIQVSLPVRGTATGEIAAGTIQIRAGYAGPALRAVHVGSGELEATWQQLEAWAAAYGFEPGDSARWVEYPSDPATTPADQMQTALVLPLN